jgi:putative spermidine/putrescine transport system permease protein
MTRRMALRAVVLAVFAFLLAPVIIVVIASFNGGPILSFPPEEFTLRWFEQIKPSFVDGLYVSLIVATSTALLSIAFGIPAVLALSRGNFPARDALNSILLSPLMVPALVTGVALYQF